MSDSLKCLVTRLPLAGGAVFKAYESGFATPVWPGASGTCPAGVFGCGVAVA